MARLGIFGGTFDPPHLGHLILAEEAYHQLKLDRLLWVLTPDPPHKLEKSITLLQHRLDLLTAAIGDNPHFEMSLVEINRPGPHYTVDTLRILSASQPGVELVFLMGGDSLHDLPMWKNPLELVQTVSILGVMGRSGADIDFRSLDEKVPGLREKVRFVKAPLVDISASEIRRRVAQGLPIRYFVPPKVYQIITERGLYRDNPANRFSDPPRCHPESTNL